MEVVECPWKQPPPAKSVAGADVVKRYRRLDQPLVTAAEGPWRGFPPQVFPDLVGFIKAPRVEQSEASFQEVRHEHKSN
jgi:hypothetical protein